MAYYEAIKNLVSNEYSIIQSNICNVISRKNKLQNLPYPSLGEYLNICEKVKKMYCNIFFLVYTFLYTQLTFIMNVYCFCDQETRYTFINVLLETPFNT